MDGIRERAQDEVSFPITRQRLMRVFQNLFDYGEKGIVALTTSNSIYGPVPAADYGQAMLWKEGKSVDLFELCTRPVEMAAQREAMAALRSRLMRAAERVHKQLDWAEAHMSERYRELPSYARQMGGDLLLLFFVGAITPRIWRLIDVAQRRVVWESDSDEIRSACGIAGTKPGQVSMLSDVQLPLASGADHLVVQLGMTRVVFVLDGESLVPAEWSVKKRDDYTDKAGSKSSLIARIDYAQNVFAALDARTGKTSKSFPAPSRSKKPSNFYSAPESGRIAISHRGGTVDIVDGFGDSHFTIRPFSQVPRTEALRVRLANDGDWLSAYGWDVFRAVDLTRREVAELPAPPPNLEDDPERVLYDGDMLATRYGVAFMDQSGLSVIPHSDLSWQPVIQPGRGASKKSGATYQRHLDQWRKPALTLKPAKKGNSWLYGSPDLPESEVPLRDGRPMQLLARVDLEDVKAARPENPWPKHGALYFFTAVDAEGAPLEDDLRNLNATQVLWSPGPFITPADSGERLAVKRPLKLAAHKADMPDISAVIVDAAMLSDAELEEYRDWLEQRNLADQPAGHRLGGYPTILQNNDLEAQAARFADDAHYPPRDSAEKAAASRWRLLLQLDSDDVCIWGTDSGVLYFLIHEDDLSRQNFSRIVSVCEGL
ncbi:YwqG family protein [Dyella choica]|uniref:DUF1963 domain-containing protein n=1 Tax=Dyella choica TaxID=1927959 RepID=A0A432M628_9GAMM|nr:YwqG family protein [Dyella choica]RUL75970.1 DUF1963 domain-containing protein [Dyella choica]